MPTETLGKIVADDLLADYLEGPNGSEWSKIIRTTREHLRSNEYPPSYVRMIHMGSRPGFDSALAMSFLSCHTSIRSGELVIFAIPMGNMPYADKNLEANDGALKLLPEPYYGTFFGGTQGQDGKIGWNRAVHGAVVVGNELHCAVLPRHCVPLEVGTITAHKMALYLSGSVTGVARWPYGSETIYVLVKCSLALGIGDYSVEQLHEMTGESIETFMFHPTRNPFCEWNIWNKQISKS